MFQWLNHSPVPTNDFKHRELSLWLHNDAVMRYQSYATSDLLVPHIPCLRVCTHANACIDFA